MDFNNCLKLKTLQLRTSFYNCRGIFRTLLTSTMERFAKIVNGKKSLTIFEKCSDKSLMWPKYASAKYFCQKNYWTDPIFDLSLKVSNDILLKNEIIYQIATA